MRYASRGGFGDAEAPAPPPRKRSYVGLVLLAAIFGIPMLAGALIERHNPARRQTSSSR